MTHKEFADSLRKIATFFEKHTELKVPGSLAEIKYFEANGKAEMAQVAKALGSCQKEVEGNWFHLVKMFGEIKFIAVDYRNRICQKVVVGTKMVEEVRTPAREEEIIPAHEVEVYEWHCPESLLDEVEESR